MEHAREEHEVSERRACRVVRQWRGTQRYLPLRPTDEDELTQAILALAAKYGRYGHRRIAVLLRDGGGQGSSAADLAPRRAEGTAETAGARAAVVGRWFVCALAPGACKRTYLPCSPTRHSPRLSLSACSILATISLHN